MLTLASTSLLHALDWFVIVAYLLVLLGSGLWLARREPTGADEYFLAGRRMPAWAVAFSVIASTLSVATFTGVPQQTFAPAGNLAYLSTNLGGFLAILVVAYIFIPAFYRHQCTTIYELLERRMGTGAKHAASAAFMLGRVFASGARIYIGAIPLALIMFGPERSQEPTYLAGAIVVMVVVAVLYTLIGGIASVIWTDVIQTLVLLGAVLAGVFLLLNRIPALASDIIFAWQHPIVLPPASTGQLAAHAAVPASKLALFDSALDLSKPFTLLTAVLGFSLLNLAAYGTDHDMVQRMLTCKNAVAGGRSAITAMLMGIPIVALFLLVGLLLHVFYSRPDLMGSNAPAYAPPAGERVFVTFILREMPPGLSGLMVAGLFAVGLGSLNSAINAMAATAVKDFYTQLAPGRSDRHYLAASRWATAAWGVVLGAFAVACIFWKRSEGGATLIDFALGVMTFAYSGLLAVFLTALLTRRGSSASAVAALVTGFVVVALMQPAVFSRWAACVPLPGTDSRTLADVTLAYPWHMMIATLLALCVCCLGKRPAHPQDARSSPLPYAA